MTLNEVKVGQTATIVRLGGEGGLRRRMMEMGLTKGTPVRVRRIAPFGDPVELTVRGYELSLRRSEAAAIEVERKFFEERISRG